MLSTLHNVRLTQRIWNKCKYHARVLARFTLAQHVVIRCSYLQCQAHVFCSETCQCESKLHLVA